MAEIGYGLPVLLRAYFDIQTVPTYGDDSTKHNLDDNTYASMVFFADDLTMATNFLCCLPFS
uniref:Uncharacterized protein n=1 Tax=Oryza meridionalis TaxID=40149 RepID=A0A0E0D1A6_9ORYZ